jgi:hypothetical protein
MSFKTIKLNNSISYLISLNLKKVTFVYTENEYIEKILLDSLSISFKNEVHKIPGYSVTKDWIQSNLYTNDLFSSNMSYILFETRFAKTDSLKFIYENINLVDGKNVIIFLQKLNQINIKNLDEKTLENCDHFKIEMPKFWEKTDHFKFVLSYFNITLPHTHVSKIVELLDPTTGSYFAYCSKLLVKNNFISNDSIDNISEDFLLELIYEKHLDYFKFCDLINSNNLKDCLKSTINFEMDLNELRSVFYFISNHISKILDTDFYKNKKKISMYDKKIINAQKFFYNKQNSSQKVELIDFLNFLRTMDYEIRTKSLFSSEKIINKYLQYFS